MLAIFCEICRAEIVEYGSPVVFIYDIICEQFLTYKKPPVFRQKDVNGEIWTQMIGLLERKGMLITTEIDRKFMSVKPVGISCIEGREDCECLICFDRSKHYVG